MTDVRVEPIACACASLRRAARAVTVAYEAELRDTGIRVPQFSLLHVLSRRGESTQGDLGAFLALDSTTLSRTLRPLAARGWIRSRTGTDRRERYWAITAAGRRVAERVTPAWERAQARLRARLGGAAGKWEAMLGELATVAALATKP